MFLSATCSGELRRISIFCLLVGQRVDLETGSAECYLSSRCVTPASTQHYDVTRVQNNLIGHSELLSTAASDCNIPNDADLPVLETSDSVFIYDDHQGRCGSEAEIHVACVGESTGLGARVGKIACGIVNSEIDESS